MNSGFKIQKTNRGDTIVEVLISMAILAVVLATAYATTTRSFHSGLNAQFRNQALLIAQQQVEVLKNADINNSPALAYYKSTSGAFCIDPNQVSNPPVYGRLDLSASNPSCPTPIGSPTPGQFTLSDTYNRGGKQEFAVTVQWQSTVSSQQNRVVLYYKASNSYVP